jgi:hypothetical protein
VYLGLGCQLMKPRHPVDEGHMVVQGTGVGLEGEGESVAGKPLSLSFRMQTTKGKSLWWA